MEFEVIGTGGTLQGPSTKVTIATAEIAGIKVIGYLLQLSRNGNAEFVVSPKKTLEGLVNRHQVCGNKGTIPLSVAEKLVYSCRISPYYVALYLSPQERLDFVLETVQPSALD